MGPERTTGAFPAELAATERLVRSRLGAAQLVVIHDGETVVDYAQHVDRDALFWAWSASKPYMAILAHHLAERGVLDLDQPVAALWPAFGTHGKTHITTRDVLHHRSGFASARTDLGDMLSMTNWRRSIRNIERARPRLTGASQPAYQFLAFGFILGEVIQRATARSLRDVLDTELLRPLGVSDTFLGLNADVLDRAVPMRGSTLRTHIVAAALNRSVTRSAIIPSAGLSLTARDLAVFYSMLAAGGVSAKGVHVVSPQTIAAATTASHRNQVDAWAREHIAWASGFQLGGPSPNPYPPLGAASSPSSFGHNGSNVTLGWTDPVRRLTVAYLTSTIRADNPHHITAVADSLSAHYDAR